MSDTPIFDEVNDAFAGSKKHWQRQAMAEAITNLESLYATHACDKKKCLSKCSAFKEGYEQAVAYLKLRLEK